MIKAFSYFFIYVTSVGVCGLAFLVLYARTSLAQRKDVGKLTLIHQHSFQATLKYVTENYNFIITTPAIQQETTHQGKKRDMASQRGQTPSLSSGTRQNVRVQRVTQLQS